MSSSAFFEIGAVQHNKTTRTMTPKEKQIPKTNRNGEEEE